MSRGLLGFFLDNIDWISPTISIADAMITGAGSLAIAGGYEHDAADILRKNGIKVRGQDYDREHRMWILRVSKQDTERAAQILRGY